QTAPPNPTYPGTTLPTPPASLFMIYPGEVHANRAHDQWGCSYRTLFVDAELMRRAATQMQRCAQGLPFFPTAVVTDSDVLAQYLALHRALEQPAASLEREVLLLDLLATLLNRFAERCPAPRPFGAERQAISRARDYLVAHYAENVSLDTLARIAALSPYHFNRVFAAQC